MTRELPHVPLPEVSFNFIERWCRREPICRSVHACDLSCFKHARADELVQTVGFDR